MEISIEEIIKNLESNDLEQFIAGVDDAIELMDIFSSKMLSVLAEGSFERMLVAERISMLSSKYFNSLKRNLESNDEDLKFWSATLIVHYFTNEDGYAVNVLIDAVKNGELNIADVATVILIRKGVKEVAEAILFRLTNRVSMGVKEKSFYEEKLETIKHKSSSKK